MMKNRVPPRATRRSVNAATTTPQAGLQAAHTQMLKDAGISVTLPRLELLRILHESGHAISAQDAFLAHIDANLAVPLATVYVNLKRLEEVGLVRRFKLESSNKSLYALAGEHGPCRIVCRDCGKLLLLDDDRLNALLALICQDQGMRLCSYALTLEAECGDDSCEGS